MKYQVRVVKPGPFSQTIPLYVDDGGLRTMEFTVKGVAVARPSAVD